jgi:acyl-CoA reductase-like NAD-dependent aldehyde dehydrogenase
MLKNYSELLWTISQPSLRRLFFSDCLQWHCGYFSFSGNTQTTLEIANGTVYGLAGYVWSSDIAKARRVGARLRAGRIYLNNAPHGKAQDVEAPFGGYKQSGNGRECGVFGFEEYLEVKAVIGYDAA